MYMYSISLPLFRFSFFFSAVVFFRFPFFAWVFYACYPVVSFLLEVGSSVSSQRVWSVDGWAWAQGRTRGEVAKCLVVLCCWAIIAQVIMNVTAAFLPGLLLPPLQVWRTIPENTSHDGGGFVIQLVLVAGLNYNIQRVIRSRLTGVEQRETLANLEKKMCLFRRLNVWQCPMALCDGESVVALCDCLASCQGHMLPSVFPIH